MIRWIKVRIVRVVHFFNCPVGQDLAEYWFQDGSERH